MMWAVTGFQEKLKKPVRLLEHELLPAHGRRNGKGRRKGISCPETSVSNHQPTPRNQGCGVGTQNLRLRLLHKSSMCVT
jgi:hypothetical protein